MKRPIDFLISEAYELGMAALADAWATKMMLEDAGVESNAEAVPALVGFLPEDVGVKEFENVCPFTDPEQQPECDPDTPYRTIQGECNNLEQPLLGKSFTPLSRVLDNAFDDGLLEARSLASNGDRLPGVRAVSTTVRLPETVIESSDFTSILVAFAQFVDHDTDHVPVTRK